MARSPFVDVVAFAERLADHGVLVLPGTVAELPGCFRMSLSAPDEMIDRRLTGFETAIRDAPTSSLTLRAPFRRGSVS
jgi:aspartate/methionine/tyrosine aminotransferase